MLLVHRGAVTCRFSIGLAHVGSFFGVAVIVGPLEVIHAGARIDPNHGIGWAAGMRLLIGRKLTGAQGPRQRTVRRFGRRLRRSGRIVRRRRGWSVVG
jgi:hypothetical protein